MTPALSHTAEAQEGAAHDVTILASLPGVGRGTLATLLTEWRWCSHAHQLLRGDLDPARTNELTDQMRAAGLPV